MHAHFKRFLIDADPRDTNMLWDQMYRASMFYGRKGFAITVISCIDLAIWDLLGKIRGEPVYKLIGGRTKEFLSLYSTGPLPAEAKRLGFWGGKVPLPYGPEEPGGLKKNFNFLAEHRRAVGPDYPIMVCIIPICLFLDLTRFTGRLLHEPQCAICDRIGDQVPVTRH